MKQIKHKVSNQYIFLIKININLFVVFLLYYLKILIKIKVIVKMIKNILYISKLLFNFISLFIKYYWIIEIIFDKQIMHILN